MKKIFNRKIIALLLCVSLLLSTVGCGGAKNDRMRVTMYIPHAYMLETFMPYLQEKFPDVNLEFMAGDNGAEHLALLAEHGDMPDIFFLNNAGRNIGRLKEYCYDLRETEVAAATYSSYISRYTNSDGSVYLIPAVGRPGGIVANKKLFEQYNIPLPTDYDSYISACAAFREQGVTPYAPDSKYNYSSSYMMFGLGAEHLMSAEGMSWTSGYEQGTNNTLDDNVWLPIFEETEQFVKDNCFPVDSLAWGWSKMMDGFCAGQSAMIRGMTSEVAGSTGQGPNEERVLIPWYAPGQTQNEAWLIVEPGAGIAAGISKAAMEDPDRAELVMSVYDAIYSPEALNLLVEINGGGMVSFTDRLSLELEPCFDSIKPYVESNRLILVLDGKVQDALLAGFSAMVGEGKSPGEALAIASRTLEKSLEEGTEPEEVVITSQKTYSAEFDPQRGCEVESVIANTLREYVGADVLLNPYTIHNAPIYAMEYSASEVGRICAPSGFRLQVGEVSGAELREIVKGAVEAPGYAGTPFNDCSLPVSSGMELKISSKDDGYRFEDLTIDGKPVDNSATYRLAFINFDGRPQSFCSCVIKSLDLIDRFEVFGEDDSALRTVFVQAVMEHGGFAEPTQYLILKK